MSYLWGNGVGESAGDSLITATTPLYTSGSIYWVNSDTGNNSNGGTERTRPLATIAQAITNATDDDIIVLMNGHLETITSQQNISERLTIVGAGTSGGIPTVKFTRGFAGVMFNITADNVSLRNIRFPGSSSAGGLSGRIVSSGARFHMKGCYVECGANDSGGPGVSLVGDYPTIESTTFISTSTSTPPYPGLHWDTTRVGIWILNCIGDGGTVGFKHGTHIGSPAIDGVSAISTAIKIEGQTLRNGADVLIFANGGFAQVGTATGGGMVTV